MIVITTPTGTIGAAIAEALREAGAPLCLIARDPGRLPADLSEHAEVIVGSHSDPSVLEAALEGADALFVLVPPDFTAPDVTEQYLSFARPIADAVRSLAVPRLVAVSSLGRGYAGPAGQLSAAWAMDEQLESSGAAYRSLQPPFFMENLLRQASLIRERGTFALTADPDTAYPAVATGDVARAAAALLADPTWTGQQGVVVREPVDHTPREMATIMSEALGHAVAYRQVAIEDYRAQFSGRGASVAATDAMVEMAQAQADGVYPTAGEAGSGTTFETWCLTTLVRSVALPR